jgi:hypothetical protein
MTLTLRVVTTLFQTARENLKFQFEWFLDFLMARVNAGVLTWDVDDGSPAEGEPRNRDASVSTAAGSTSSSRNIIIGEVREMFLETLAQFWRIPTFASELWLNFDGDISCQQNLFEEVVRFMSKVRFFSPRINTTSHMPIHSIRSRMPLRVGQ